jgi:hypothetical protein
MLFQSPQPTILKEAIESMQSNKGVIGDHEELLNLEAATRGLEESLSRMAMARTKGGMPEEDGPRLATIPTTHEAIFNHSRRSSQARWVWITKSSIVDEKGNLGFPASVDEVRKFGAKVRRMLLRPPPSKLQESFTSIVAMNWEEHQPTQS